MRNANSLLDLFPEDLLDTQQPAETGRTWRVMYTMSRQEKALARDLFGYKIPFYLPLLNQTKVYGSRTISSSLPIFPNYVFVCCGEEERITSLTTNRISRVLDVADAAGLRFDLIQLRKLIASGAALTVEGRLTSGNRVRIKRGPLAGLEGVVVARRGEQRLIIAVNFLQQGASIAIDDYMVEPVR